MCSAVLGNANRDKKKKQKADALSQKENSAETRRPFNSSWSGASGSSASPRLAGKAALCFNKVAHMSAAFA